MVQGNAGRNWRVAVVGAGPSGLYATDALLKREAQVDVFEAQFFPFGLVRYGVAPDHEKIKRTQAVFERTLEKPGVRLFCNVKIGEDLSVEELLEHYDQVLVTIGSAGARHLGLPGESLPGCVAATDFVNWYNGHPSQRGFSVDLATSHAVVVGVGNVAIDIARILTKNPDELATTDIADDALARLRESRIDQVTVLSRRGPNQAKFDIKEVRELASLSGVEVVVDGYIPRRKTEMSEFLGKFPRAPKTPRTPGVRRVVLRFCASPKKMLGRDRVEQLVIERNDLVESAASMKAVGTGDFSTLDVGLVVAAIGYQGTPLPGLPFWPDTGTIFNADGRVLEEPDGAIVPRVYVSGWIKRGPTGLIGTNKGCATKTVELMETDLDQVGPQRDPTEIPGMLAARGVRALSVADFVKLNAYELSAGEKVGKARKKLMSLSEALGVLDGAGGS